MKAQDVVCSLERILAVGKGRSLAVQDHGGPAPPKRSTTIPSSSGSRSPRNFPLHLPSSHRQHRTGEEERKSGDHAEAWLSKNSAGSGAYKITQFDPAIGFVAERFPTHFKGWGPKWIDEIEFRAVKDTNTRVLGLMRGDFNGIGGYLQTDQLNRIKSNPATQVLEAESMRVMMAQINMTRVPFNDVHIRRGINYAFDYDGFNKEILGGLVERNPTPLPNTIWGVPKDVKGYSFDIEKAKAEFAQAKVKLDKPIELAYLTGFQQSEQAAQLLQNGLTKAGVQSKVVGYPWPTIVERFKDPNTTPDLSIYWISTLLRRSHNWVGEMFRHRPPEPSRTPHTTRIPRSMICWRRLCGPPFRPTARRCMRRRRASSSTRRPDCGFTTPNGTAPIPASSRASCSARSGRRRKCGPRITRADFERRGGDGRLSAPAARCHRTGTCHVRT